MTIIETPIPDLIVLEPRVFADDRGYFLESFNSSKWPQAISDCDWVQDNESKSTKGVLRGLHYQCEPMGQAKLVRAVIGEVFDVAVDIRPGSSTYGQWYGTILSEANKRQMYVPRGFAHGFLVMSETAIFAYKCDNYYSKEDEGGILYNDPNINIEWPEIDLEFLLSEKDSEQPIFGEHKQYA